MVRTIAASLAACLLSSTFAFASDFDSAKMSSWHQWRGPLATGVAPQANPPTKWDEQTNIKWKVEIPGRGSASPIVWQDKIFLLTAVDAPEQEAAPDNAAAENTDTTVADPQQSAQDERPGRGRGGRGGFGRGAAPSTPQEFVVICMNRNTGETIWQKTAARLVPHEGHHDTNTYASASALTDGQHVYASFGSRGLYCYDMDGNLVWERDLGDMETRLGFGEGSTPTLHGDTLVVNWDHEGQSFIVALDARNGETRWQTQRDESTTWATPLVIERDGRTQVVTNGENRVRSYDLTSGELLWECGGQAANPIPSPVQLDDLVICMTGYRGYAAYAIPLDSSGDITGTDKVAWNIDDHTPYISSPLLYEGKLYFTKGRNAIASCVDAATGEVHYSNERLPESGTMYASPVGAAGKVYYSDREGTTTVIEHGPEFDVLSINKLDEGIDASPAIVGDTMYIRGEKHLYAIREAQ